MQSRTLHVTLREKSVPSNRTSDDQKYRDFSHRQIPVDKLDHRQITVRSSHRFHVQEKDHCKVITQLLSIFTNTRKQKTNYLWAIRRVSTILGTLRLSCRRLLPSALYRSDCCALHGSLLWGGVLRGPSALATFVEASPALVVSGSEIGAGLYRVSSYFL